MFKKVDGKGAGFGGSYVETNFTGGADASIGTGTMIESDNLDVLADTDIRNINISISGGSAGKVSISGAVSVATINTATIAQIAAGAVIDANNVVVGAHDFTQHINVAGGVSKGNVGIGASVSFNTINRNVSAFIGNRVTEIVDGSVITTNTETNSGGSVTARGNVFVDAQASGLMGSYSLAGGAAMAGDGTGDAKFAGSADVSVNNAVQTTQAYIDGGMALDVDGGSDYEIDLTPENGANSSEYVAARGLNVYAENSTEMQVFSGAVTVSTGSSSGLAGSFSFNDIANKTYAHISDTTVNESRVGTNVTISAKNTGGLFALGASGSGSTTGKGIVIAGQYAQNDVDNEAKSYLEDSTINATSTSSVKINAEDTSTIHAIAGAVTLGGQAGLGISFSDNSIDNTTEAYSKNSKITTLGSFEVKAKNDNEIKALASSLGITKNLSGSGSIATNNINNITRAYIDNTDLIDNTIAITGSLVVDATDDSDIEVLIGSVALSGDAGVGASVSTNLITNTVESYIKNVAQTNLANQTTVNAGMTGTIRALTAAIGGTLKVLGLGAAVSVNRISNNINAFITGDNTDLKVKNITVKAMSDADIETISVAVGAGETVGVGGSFSVNLLQNNVSSYIDDGAKVTAENNVAVLAESDDRIQIASGAAGVGIGVKSAGIGITSITNEVAGSTRAYISGANTKVTAFAKDSSDRITVNDGALNTAVDLGQQVDIDNYNQLDLKADKTTKQINGLAVNASSTQHIEAIGVNIGAGAGGLGFIADVNVVTGTTNAFISDATINESLVGAGAFQQVDVNASNHSYINSFLGNLTIGAIGIGAAGEYSTLSRGVYARVSGSTLNSRGALNVNALATQGISSLLVGGSFGGSLAIAGTGVVAQFQGITEAEMMDVTIDADSVSVKAESDDDMHIISGSAALGSGISIGGSFSVGVNNSTTRAQIIGQGRRSRLNVTNAVDVEAISTSHINNNSLSVAGSTTTGAVAGSVVSNTVTNTTEAKVLKTDIGSTTDKVASLKVAASNTVNLVNRAGAAAGGLATGIGAGAAINVLKSRTTANVEDSNIYTSGALDITADSQNDVYSLAVMAGAGALGFGGGASVTLVGDNLTNEADEEIDKGDNGTLTAINDFSTSDKFAAFQGSDGSVLTADEQARLNDGASADVKDVAKGDEAVPLKYKTAATIGLNVLVDSGSLNVKAKDLTAIESTIGAVGAGIVGVGGAVSVTSVKATVIALIDETSDITTGDLTVSAIVDRDADDTVDVEALAGSAGYVGLGAAVTIVNIENTINAGLAGDIKAGTGTVTVLAQDKSQVSAKALGAQVGAFSAGAVISRADKHSVVQASISDSVTAANIDITAKTEGKLLAHTQSAAAGIIGSGSGADARATDESIVSAVTASGTTLTALGGVINVIADAKTEVEALSQGISISSVGAVGVSNAFAKAATTVKAYLGDNNTVTAKDVSVLAIMTRAVDNIKATSYGSSVGLLVGLGTTYSDASNISDISSYIGNNSTLTITGTTAVKANIDSKQFAVADGYSFGTMALGVNQANARSDTLTKAFLGTNVKVEGGDLELFSGGEDNNYAEAISGAGALVGGSSSLATTTSSSDTQAYISDSSAGRTINVNTLALKGQHTAKFNSVVDSSFASLFGGSGAYANNTQHSLVTVNVGSNVAITAKDIDINAENLVRKSWLVDGRYNVFSGSGGIINGAAGKSISDINLITKATIADNSTLIVESGLSGGELAISALNDVYAKDKVKLDSGGVIPIGLVESKITNDVNDATVQVGSSELRSVNDIILSSRTIADIKTQANAKTYGLSGVALGTTLSRVDADNKVTVKSGAYLRAGGDVKLLSGQDKNGIGNDFDIVARTDLWNATALPFVTVPKADAKLTQNNTIAIESGAELGSVKDTYLLADEGSVFVEGKGIGKDAYRAALEAVANAFRKLVGEDEISFDIKGGSESKTSTSSIVNNGIVKAGIQNKQYLTIRTDGTVDASDPQGQSDGVTFTETQENLSNNIDAQIAAYEQLKLDFSDLTDVVAAYQAEIDRLNAQKGQLAGLNTNVTFINVDGIFAQSSNIHIEADSLTGAGQIEAPGDALIQVKNNSEKFLRTDWLMIPENSGGRITFNDIQIHNNAEINARNESGSASFSNVVTSESSAAPLIRVENTYRPGSGGNPAGIEPDIEIANDITNLRGTVEIINEAGSVNISGNVLANTIDIQAGKDLVLSYVDGFRHLGDEPKSSWDSVALASESARVNRIVNGIRSGGSTLIAGNNIFASARILNINGLLQSGLPDNFITLDAAPQIYEDFDNSSAGFNSLAWARDNYLNNPTEDNQYYRVKAASGDTIDASYNAALDRIELQDVKVQGGYMQLFGQIVSTGAGELRVIDGYGRIDVTNNSTTDLVLNQLDVGVEREGQLKITDTNFRGVNNQPLTTWYRRLGEQVSVWDSTSVDASGNPNNLVRRETIGQKDTYYSPKAGQYFSWLRKDSTIKTEYRDTKVIKCFVLIDCSESTDRSYSSSTTAPVQIRDDLILFTNDTVDYRYKTSTIRYDLWDWHDDPNKTNTFSEYVVYSERHTYDRRKEYFNTYHQHNVKAFHDIDINFIGYDSSQLSVVSQGNILINGGLGNSTDLTTLNTQGSIEQLTANASVGGRDINLIALAGIGNNSTVKTNLNGGLLSARTTNGNITLEEVLGDLNYSNLLASNGDVNITVDGDLIRGTGSALIRGGAIELTSNYGDLGTSANRLVIDSGTNLANGDGLTAKAASDIVLTEQSGDLLVVSVEAKGGDVDLAVPTGSLIDANLNETRDTRTEAELLSLWDDMLLVGTKGVDEESYAAKTIQGFENNKTSEYERYWQYRSNQADPSNYDANFSVVSSAAEIEAFKQQGWTDVKITAFDQQRTEQYHAYHIDYAGLGDAYNASYSYEATSGDIAELSQGSVWTENQLKFALGGGLLKETSDTETRIEEFNVSGLNVSLDVANSVGKLSGDIVIDNRPTVLNLTDEQRLALASAEAGDILITATEIRIKQRDDIDVDVRDSLNIVAGQDIFIGSEQDIKIDHITSTSSDSVVIKGGQGIYNVASDSNANIDAGNIILEAARGSIGSVLSSISYDSPTAFTARAGQDIYLKNSGDMLVSTLFARNHIQLEAVNIIDALDTDNINIRSKSLNLIATGIVGESTNALDIALDIDGLLTATVASVLGTGAPALSLLSDRTLNLGQLQVASDIVIEVRNGDLIATDDITVLDSVNGLSMQASSNIALNGMTSIVGNTEITAGNDVAIAELLAAGDIRVNAGNDISLGSIKAVGYDVAISAGGNIANSRTDELVMLEGDNFTLTSISGQVGSLSRSIIGDSNGVVNINAATGIFYEERYGDLFSTTLVSNTGSINLNVVSGRGDLGDVLTSGDINIAVSGSLLDIDTVTAGAASFMVAEESGQLNITDLQVKDRLFVTADIINLPTVEHTGTVDKLLLSLSGNDAGIADEINIDINSSVGTFYEKLSTKNVSLSSSSGDIELLNFTVSGVAEIKMPDYSVIIYDGPPKLFPNADIQLVGGTPINLAISAGSKLIFTNAMIVDYQPDYIINSFSTDNSLSLIGEKRTAQQTGTNGGLMGDDLYQSLWGSANPFSEFFDRTQSGTIIYDPELLVQTTNDDELF